MSDPISDDEVRIIKPIKNKLPRPSRFDNLVNRGISDDESRVITGNRTNVSLSFKTYSESALKREESQIRHNDIVLYEEKPDPSISEEAKTGKAKKRKSKAWYAIPAALLVVISLPFLFNPLTRVHSNSVGSTELPDYSKDKYGEATYPPSNMNQEVFGVYDDDDPAKVSSELQSAISRLNEERAEEGIYAETIDIAVNDIPLTFIIPHNANPILSVGSPGAITKSSILGLQAADIRTDNQQILGAFVQEGELLGKGTTRMGFCSIIDGTILIGISESTSLFEEAINKKGYFFRQYPLIMAQEIIEVVPENKSRRRALCSIKGRIMIAATQSEESFHDFSQALLDLGVENAINLAGGDAFGWYRDINNSYNTMGTDIHTYKNENYIVWMAK